MFYAKRLRVYAINWYILEFIFEVAFIRGISKTSQY